MFAGLTSRCTRPRAWAASRASATRATIRAARPGGMPLGRGGDQVLEARALDEAHRDEEAPVVVAGAVDRDDVRVLEARGGERLAHEELAQVGRRRRARADQLQRDGAPELGVVGAVDDAHAADAGERLDGVAGDDRARRHARGRRRVAPASRENRVRSADSVRTPPPPRATPDARIGHAYIPGPGDFR